jgi:NADPH:quinone reductase-like Zn-dependent oxidoreductase
MPPQNRAAWLMAKHDGVQVVNNAPYNKPEADELVIKTMAVAINPADVYIQKLGIIIDTYPAILGCDAAGIVEEVGSAIEDFKPGDRVLGMAKPKAAGIYKYSGFQQYTVLQMPQIAKIPDNANFTDAAVLPLGLSTATSCLFEESILGLELPPGQGGKGKTVLIWGASSSVGSCGVQLAAAAGYEVIAVASEKNHPLVKSLGAKQAFDQSDSNIVDNIVAVLKDKTCVGAFDAISKKETLNVLCDILHESGARKFVASVAPGAESLAKNDVTIKNNLHCAHGTSHVNKHIWRVFLEPALASGAFLYKPQADIVGNGLEDVQKGCDLLAQGVSAKKLVIAL